jgi:2-iminobutanoate/2-iminopropanoate deaminase
MKKKVIQTDRAPKAVGPYSQAIQCGDLLFVSGQIPIDPTTGAFVGGDIQTQTRRVLDNVKGLLESQGLGMENVVKSTLFITDMKDFAAVNEIYATYFPSPPPARSTVAISGLAKDAKIELEVIASY